MKKVILISVLVVIIVLTAFLIYKSTSLPFDAFLDDNGIRQGESQMSFKLRLNDYMYNGQELSAWTDETYWDDKTGGGSSSEYKYFGLYNNYINSDGVVKYVNEMYTEVPLVGLELPYHITFKDSLTKVLRKIGLSVDPYDGFVNDSDTPGIMTLSDEDGVAYRIVDGSKEQSPDFHIIEKFTYMIAYTEKTEHIRTDGSVAEATRYVYLYFLNDSDLLGRIEFGVKEVYPSD